MSESIITNAPDRTIIGNGDVDFIFSVTQKSGVDVDLTQTGTLIEFFMCQYGSPEMNILTKTSATSAQISIDDDDSSKFYVHLKYTDTVNLQGAYEYQIQVTTPVGKVYRRLKGNVNIIPKDS